MPIRKERSDAAAHRRLILETARNLFSQYGVSEVSMHQIAKTAGIGQGTLYRRYAHKGDLCSDLMEDTGQRLLDELERDLADISGREAAERLGLVMDRIIDFIDEKCQFLIPLHNVYACETDRTAFFRSPIYLRVKELVTKLYDEMRTDNGEKEKSAFAAHALLSSLNPIGYLHLRNELGYSKDAIKQYYRCLYSRV
ncbi:TetR/AcrR family transcriptional regulator [Cohnella zeiphila]|uniref:TetR/AcrR family transcriptional regulator n=1 Tax=Cohnella zeiphila TaxID=2761120 RepID=A0A7X0SKP6_9BACL|nr:TetR/AcrR family transcriptional regulator [Cohnella zeiphila]MBB6731757.1 TetR/AcrR family transcriptional regulator [Cohnella zeiphila]